jgi:hypothetical protein
VLLIFVLKSIKQITRLFTPNYVILIPLRVRSDDILSLHNFRCILAQKWSSQGDLCSKRAEKLEKKQRMKTCHDLDET